MWADLKDRIAEYQEMHGVDLSGVIEVSDNKHGENYAKNLKTGATIGTKGFQVSNNNNTASLKSLAGATHLYIDEAEETSEDDFRKLKLSFRKKGVKIQIIRAFNPPYAGHWLWKDYDLRKIGNKELYAMCLEALDLPKEIIRRVVEANQKTYFEATLKKDQSRYLAIRTNFTNNYENLNEEAIKEFEKLFFDDFHYFATHILGLIPNEQGDVVYNDYSRTLCATDRLIRQGDALQIGMDFNITKMSAVVHVVENGVEHAVAELVNIYDTHTMAKTIAERYAGHKIIIYPDASGQNRKTSGTTDVKILESFGFTVRARASNPPVRDRINVLNTKLRKGSYKVNPYTCPELAKAFEQLKYKNGEPDKLSGLDHVTDAAGYFAYDSEAPRIKIRGSHHGG